MATPGAAGKRSGGAAVAALVEQDLRGIVEALATLRRAAERRVDLLGPAGDDTGSRAQLALTDGVADADVHGNLAIDVARPC